MFATRKYTARDRIETAREFAHKYPDRVAVLVDSPHWRFFSFKCLLVPKNCTVSVLTDVICDKWSYKFKQSNPRLILYPHHTSLNTQEGGEGGDGGGDEMIADDNVNNEPRSSAPPRSPLSASATLEDIATRHSNTDGLLYLSVKLVM